jgi:hypothetical protein
VLVYCTNRSRNRQLLLHQNRRVFSITQVFIDSGQWAYAILLVLVIGVVYAIVRLNQLYRKEKIDAGGFLFENYAITLINDQLKRQQK